ncbi:hypothetical protein CC86DRAFT_374431 [Ophiobolus disseminans]|uniref:Uncharacterized protein n=1 Tax=Ophiobolus disseminans TaxID=1469910 RepID=A0A6A6ZIR6_9PLEO|nr:hypothetical protein CC86DRAFT_374431 [Ophiobolus disseminans]
MYPFSLLHIIHAANSGVQQNFFSEFDAYNYPEFSYTPTAYAKTPNTGILNYFDLTAGGRANCTDATVVLGSTPPDAAQINLWSCALFPNLTHDYRESNLSNNARTFVLGNNTDTSISTSTQVTTFISTCLEAWCNNSEGCGKTACNAERMALNNVMLSAGAIDICLDSICGVRRISSPDIAGIGVIASIFIQLTITLAAPLVLLLCQVALLRLYSRSRGLIDEMTSSLQADQSTILSFKTLQESLIITLDEFQRAQCCFAIAIDIASLITLYNGREKVTRIDRNAITLASFAGTLPTIVVFATLLIHKQRDMAYTTYLTSFTWILSLITGYLPLTRDLGEKQYTYIDAQPAACGGQAPAHVCKEWGVEISVERFSWVASIVSAITMVSLALRYALPILLSAWSYYVPPSWRTWLSVLPKPIHEHMAWYIPDKLRPMYVHQTLRAVVYVALATSMVNCGVYVFMILAYIDKGSMHTEWSFGQVVAVAVWLPTILSFVNDCVYGPLRGRSNGLPRTLRVVRVDE